MSWQPTDEVTTTAGSIWQSQIEAHEGGVLAERERIIALIKCVEDTDWLIDLIKGANNEQPN